MSKFTSKLHDANILILGGTSGIGFTIAEACLEYRCAHLTIAGSKQSSAEAAVSQLRKTYPSEDFPTDLMAAACDLSSEQQLEQNLNALLDRATQVVKLDHIVNTAGDAFSLPSLSSITAESFAKAGVVRFYGTLMLAKAAVCYLKPSHRSSLTFTGGSMATKPQSGWTTSASWTSAKEGLTRGLAVDITPIRVNCVAPGIIETGWFTKLDPEKRDLIVAGATAKTLVGVLGKAEDVAEAYLYCMKDNYATGQIVHSNGGCFLV